MIGHNSPPTFSPDSGWVAIARSMRNHPLVGFHLFAKPADPSRGAAQPAIAFIDLIMECRYEDGFVMNGGRKMEIRRGQLVGAVSWLAARWNWTPMAVRIWLDKLEADMMISRHVPGASDSNKHAGKVATVISLCNYSQYQQQTTDKQQSEQQTNSKQATNEQQQYKENKETKEQEEYPQTPTGGSGSSDVGKLTVRAVAREAFTEWQVFAAAHGLPVPRDSTFDTFASQISSRIREHAASQTRTAMLEVWHTALCNVAKSKFLRGLSGQDFKADLGMITRPKNFAKLISGGYGNGAASIDARWSAYAPAQSPSAPVDKAAIERARQERIRKAQADGWEFEGGDPNALIG